MHAPNSSQERSTRRQREKQGMLEKLRAAMRGGRGGKEQDGH